MKTMVLFILFWTMACFYGYCLTNILHLLRGISEQLKVAASPEPTEEILDSAKASGE
jgi:hypothetical protein